VGACEAAVRELLQTDARVAPQWAALTQQQQRCVRSLNGQPVCVCVCVCACVPGRLAHCFCLSVCIKAYAASRC
jgi:hypothetical protein